MNPKPMSNRLVQMAVLAVAMLMAAVAIPLVANSLSTDPAGAQDAATEEAPSDDDTTDDETDDDATDDGESVEDGHDGPFGDHDVPEEFAEFEACMDAIFDSLDEAATDEANHDAIDARIETECEPLLPEDGFFAGEGPFADMVDLGKEFADCIGEDGFDGPHGFAGPDNAVIVTGPDGEQIIELGDEPASVTITSDGDTVNVETTGDATVIDLDGLDEEFEKLLGECEHLLPEFGDGGPFGAFGFKMDFDG